MFVCVAATCQRQALVWSEKQELQLLSKAGAFDLATTEPLRGVDIHFPNESTYLHCAAGPVAMGGVYGRGLSVLVWTGREQCSQNGGRGR